MSENYILAIDQGTSSSRCVIYNGRGDTVAAAQQEFPQEYPQPGWVEHEPEEIWNSVIETCRDALSKSGVDAGRIASIGITNQRETTLVWDRETGQCVYRAIVWQDRRTAESCARLKGSGVEPMVAEKTGLRLDPYFSGTKIAWILDNVEGARERAEQGHLAFGTVDCYLLWRLTGGTVHATDATNASRTLLFNLRTQQWDSELLALFGIPSSMLPDVRDCVADFGATDAALFGKAIPIGGIAGDQHAALIGQAGFSEGMTKSTYGTGCFVLANTGDTAIASNNQMLTTMAYRIGGQATYAIEGSIFVAGSAVQWLRDQLQIIKAAPETEAIAEATGIVDHVHLVPAFAGLGAPYWDPNARGALLGLSRDTGINEIVTATLQAIAYQTCDLINAMSDDGLAPSVIRVDGGMVENDWFLQFLADMLGLPVERPVNVESTVTGAAHLAALQAGMCSSLDELTGRWTSDRLFEPNLEDGRRAELYSGWQEAVSRVRS